MRDALLSLGLICGLLLIGTLLVVLSDLRRHLRGDVSSS